MNVSYGFKISPRSFGYVVIGSTVLYIMRFRLLVYSAGYGVNRVQVVLSGFSVRLLYFVQTNHYIGMVVFISWLHPSVCV